MAKNLLHWLRPRLAAKTLIGSVDIKLLKITEVEEYYRSNPFILTGYRERTSFFGCIKSVLLLHNETINIWSHLLGFLFLAGIFLRDIIFVLPLTESGLEVTHTDFFILFTLILCYQAAMILSSLFHTFTCHSVSVSHRCLNLDLLGITLALLATYLSGIYYAFWCHPVARDFYLLTVGALFLVATAIQFVPDFASEKFSKYRVGLFFFWAAYGIVPTIHWVIMNGGFSSIIVRIMFPKIMIMYGWCGLGFFFYVTKFPERLLPGFLDILGHSHQWWHLFIFIALIYWHNTGVQFALFRFKFGCGETLTHEQLEEVSDSMSLWPDFWKKYPFI